MVTRSTFGADGQRFRSSRSTRAVVDLPTATEPPMPMMKGTFASLVPRNSRMAWKRRCASRSRRSESRREIGRYTRSTSSSETGSPSERSASISSAAQRHRRVGPELRPFLDREDAVGREAGAHELIHQAPVPAGLFLQAPSARCAVRARPSPPRRARRRPRAARGGGRARRLPPPSAPRGRP